MSGVGLNLLRNSRNVCLDEKDPLDGVLIGAPHVDETKKRQSMRIVVISPILMCPIERFIAAFHTGVSSSPRGTRDSSELVDEMRVCFVSRWRTCC
jgi:hypothetical protein